MDDASLRSVKFTGRRLLEESSAWASSGPEIAERTSTCVKGRSGSGP